VIATVDVHALPPPRHDVLAAGPALAAAVAGRFSTSDLDRLAYASDGWPLALAWRREGRVPRPPDAVAWPGTEDELAALVAVARGHRLPVVPFGGGSGVCGGTVAVRGGVVVDLKRLERLGPVDAGTRTIEVGAGVVGAMLERHLQLRGFTLGPGFSASASSTVGGWLATRAAGDGSGRYGGIEAVVLSVRGVFGTGARFTAHARPGAGPALAPLLLGSEGTLCAFTSAVLRVHPGPEARFFHAFDFASVDAGLEAVRRLVQQGLRPAVACLSDPVETALDGAGAEALARAGSAARRLGLGGAAGATLARALAALAVTRPRLVEPLTRLARRARLVLVFEGEAASAADDARAAARSCAALDGVDCGEGPARAWYHRRADEPAEGLRLFEVGAFVDALDCAAPWARVLDVFEQVRAAAAPHALVSCRFGPASADGCALRFRFVGAAAGAPLEQRYLRLWRDALGAAAHAGASVSHHRGVGLLKAAEYQARLADGRRVLGVLKRSFDPEGIMNPGKLGL
jgi:alkyldihydroxyacetonephosphate synthase